MNNRLSILCGFFLLSLTEAAIAQGVAGKSPIPVDSARDVIASMKSDRQFDLPPEAHAAVKSFRTRTVPYWSYGFSYQGTLYVETAVGKSIFSNGGTSVVSVPIIPQTLPSIIATNVL